MDIQSEFLIDMVSNAPFLAFLLWQYRVQRSDYKEAQTEMKELREKAKAEEDKIRHRWEGVVEKLDAERKTYMSDGVEKLAKVDKDMSAMKKGIALMADELKDIRYTAFEIISALTKDKEKQKESE
tara:strand:- start:990 stop:1367 length:378 start_codon:yes stop_codon:yes gene_type:complete